MNDVLGHLQHQLQSLPQATAYWVGYSGGADSHVLLHALTLLPLGAPLRAVHVHHGLHPRADAWVAHCRAVCAALGVPLEVLRVDARARPGQSPEAAARAARYGALAAVLPVSAALVTAHHDDDQAETVLLQLLRGSGPAGLAAMPMAARFARGWHLRPVLGMAREALLRYARAQDLRWIEDSSNADPRVDRSYLRTDIMPLLRQRWPALTRTLGRAARNAAEAAVLADALGETDLVRCAGPHADALAIAALASLAPPRRRNALRLWLRGLDLPTPQRVHLERIENELLTARGDGTPLVHWPGAQVRRYREHLYAMAPLAPHDAAQVIDWDVQAPLALDAPGLVLTPTSTIGHGLRRAALAGAGTLQVRFRRGGERLRLCGREGRHTLKHLLQAQGVPPWQRDRLPLLYVDDRLAAVADLWLECDFAARPGEEGVALSLSQWRPPAGGPR